MLQAGGNAKALVPEQEQEGDGEPDKRPGNVPGPRFAQK